jgi:hypothetical protein
MCSLEVEFIFPGTNNANGSLTFSFRLYEEDQKQLPSMMSKKHAD